MIKFFRQFFCKHEKEVFVRNIYGDEILEYGWKRSIWQCEACGKYAYDPMLNTDAPEFNGIKE